MGDISQIKALVFDVFGTVVDWRTSIIQELEAFGAQKGISADWAAFTDDWRALYQPSMEEVRAGRRPWTILDVLHRESLEKLLTKYGIDGLSEEEKDHINKVWHRLKPWPDSVPGLHRLKARYLIGTLSNGNIGLLAWMAKNAGLPWDVILGAEPARRGRGHVVDPGEHDRAARGAQQRERHREAVERRLGPLHRGAEALALLEDRVVGEQRRGVAVLAQAEQREVQLRRVARQQRPQLPLVRRGGGRRVVGRALPGVDRRRRVVGLAQERVDDELVVAVVVVPRHAALVAQPQVDVAPVADHPRQQLVRAGRGPAARQRHVRDAPPGAGVLDRRDDALGGGPGRGLGVSSDSQLNHVPCQS